MKKTGLQILFATAVVAGGVLAATGMVSASDRNRTIADGVYFGDIDAGGMTEVEATEAVEAYVNQVYTTPLELDVSELSIRAKASDFGANWSNRGMIKDALNIGVTGSIIERYKSEKDLENEKVVYDIEYSFDENMIEQYITKNTSAMSIEPVNAKLSRVDDEFVIEDGINGVDVDAKASAKKIIEEFTKGWKGEERVFELVSQVREPALTSEMLSKITDVIGSYSTDYSSSASGRAQNVANGASKINGSILMPGQQLSVYETVKPFTFDNGYELAGAYENGTTVQSIGGGICQVSTTLYNAVIRAELQVDCRYNHSMIVSYVRPSMDAAIAEGIKDFKFTNNYDFPIYIEGYTSGGVITFKIYGQETRPSNREIVFESETTGTTEPETTFKLDSSLPLGTCETEQTAHTGYTAKLWKIVKVDGEVQSREEFNSSTYNASPKIVKVGTSGASEQAIASLNSAIASKSEDNVRSTASTLKKQADKPKPDKPDIDEDEDDEDDEDDDWDDLDDGDDETVDIGGDTGIDEEI